MKKLHRFYKKYSMAIYGTTFFRVLLGFLVKFAAFVMPIICIFPKKRKGKK